jgi:hypothetical protein
MAFSTDFTFDLEEFVIGDELDFIAIPNPGGGIGEDAWLGELCVEALPVGDDFDLEVDNDSCNFCKIDGTRRAA